MTPVRDAIRVLSEQNPSPRVIGVAAAVVAATTRVAYVRRAPLTPDPAMVLWMALRAVRHPTIPDHGLVSSFHAFQPPGLVWAAMPLVAVGGGRPEIVMIGFGLANAVALGLLAATIAERWGAGAAIGTTVLASVGPDAFLSTWIWHPSLYTGAVALLLTAGIRLDRGSRWWGAVVAAEPASYALIHYSGFALLGPSLVLLWLARRRGKQLLAPIAVGVIVSGLLWVPFLVFEAGRGLSDFTAILHGVDAARTPSGKLHERLDALKFAVAHLGDALHGPVGLTGPLDVLAAGALFYAWGRRKASTPVPVYASVIAAGLLVQTVTNMGYRTDVLMLWLLPLYGLAGWVVGQLPRAGAVAAVIAALAVVGAFDLRQAITFTPYPQRVAKEWAAAASHPAVRYTNLFHLNEVYLPCDPPYTRGSQIWYLEEVRQRGAGIRAAEAAGAFRDRAGPCASRDR